MRSIFDDIDDCVWASESLYKDIIKEKIPERKANVRQKSLLWVTTDIKKLMNKRYKTLNQYTKTKSKDDWTKYQRPWNMITEELKKAEAEYWCNAFKEVKNTKEFWSLVKKVKNTDADSNIGTWQVDEELITDTPLKLKHQMSFSVM